MSLYDIFQKTLMKRSKIQSVFLLGYLVFFLNFGPSFHRASIFGVHDHVDSSAHEQFVCSCGFDHGPTPSGESGSDSDSPDKRHGSIEKQLCDCSLCEFFKQYHAALTTSDHSIASENLSLKFETIASLVSRTAIASDARGPPLA